MTVVVDASVAAAWLLPDEGDDATDRVPSAIETSGGIAPSIFRHEARNIVLLTGRRKRITATTGDALLVRLARLPIQDEGPGEDAQIISLAHANNLTAYDAAYLALALSTGMPLATLDTRLAAAAHACGVPLLGPLAS